MKLSHLDPSGQPTMVDVSDKTATRRVALAEAVVQLPPEVAGRFADGDLQTAKGSVIQTAIIAGTMAVKKTADLIPLCHPLPIDRCKIQIAPPTQDQLVIHCEVGTLHRTGVEMEALTGASVAALTVYDMLKALSHDIVIGPTRLLSKKGGKRDFERGAES